MINLLRQKSTLIRWIVILFLTAILIFINLPFIKSFVLAGIFALGLHDFVSKISDKLRIRKNIFIVVFLFGCLSLFLFPLIFAVNRFIVLVSQPQNFAADKFIVQIKHLRDIFYATLQKISDRLGIDFVNPIKATIESSGARFGEFLFKSSTEFISQLPSITVATLIFIVYIFLMLLRSRQIKNFVIRYSILDEELTENLIAVAKSACAVTLLSTLVIGLLQATTVAIGSFLFKEGEFWFVWVVTFFLSFIPVIGAAPVGYFLSLLAFIGDRTGPALGLAITATLTGTVDNMLRPYLIVSERRVSPVIAFTCVIGALFMIGFPGLLIGPAFLNIFAGVVPVLLKWNSQNQYADT
ncbi:MAG: AI-2E family transporter [Bdellovibrio sp.]